MPTFKMPAEEVTVSSVGVRGPAGPEGVGWITGEGAPTAEAADGTLYFDPTTNDCYKRIAGAWTLLGNLRGEQGPVGPAGAESTVPGPIGLTGLTGPAGPPGESIVGPAGEKGDRGDPGPEGPQGPDGIGWIFGPGYPPSEAPEGTYHLDETDWRVYRRSEGDWNYLGTIMGQQGPQGPEGPPGDGGGGGGGSLQFVQTWLDGSTVTLGQLPGLDLGDSGSGNIQSSLSVAPSGYAQLIVSMTNPWDNPIAVDASMSPYASPPFGSATYMVDASAGPVTIVLPDHSTNVCSHGFVFVALWGDVLISLPEGASLDGQDASLGPFRVMRQPVANGLGDSMKGCARIAKPFWGANNAWTVVSGCISAA